MWQWQIRGGGGGTNRNYLEESVLIIIPSHTKMDIVKVPI